MAEARYSVGTWDTDLQAFSPQLDVPAFNLTRAQLKESLRALQAMGYSAHRTGNTTIAVRDSDTYVMVERTDGMSEEEIIRMWER